MATLSALAQAQPRVATALRVALASGRMHHAHLLIGPEEGVAREIATAVAGSVVCGAPSGTDACGTCAPCRKLGGGNHPDVLCVVPNDKGVIAVDQVREIATRVALKAAEAPKKVVLIAAFDAATPQAQNALLKILEEPPGDTCFLLTATRAKVILPTVRSRCLILRLAPPDRLAAWQTLVEAGVAAELARPLAALVGDATDAAGAVVEAGAAEVAATLGRAATPGAPVTAVVAAVQDLGQSRERADLALALLEVQVRDALARRHGVAPALLYDPAVELHAAGPSLAAAAARIAVLRRLTALHVNRTLALEAVLRDLRSEPCA